MKWTICDDPSMNGMLVTLWVSPSRNKHVMVRESAVKKYHVELDMAEWLKCCWRSMGNGVRPQEPT